MYCAPIDNALFDDIYNTCKMTGRTIEDFITSCIDREVASYRNSSGKVEMHKAKYLKHGNDTERQSYINAGKTPPAEEWTDCFYIKDTTMFGAPYRLIVFEGQLLKTPAENVRID